MLNGSLARDVVVVALPENAALAQPLYLLHISTSAAADTSSHNGSAVLNTSAPRLLIHLSADASLEVVEEYVSAAPDGTHLGLAVAEVVLEQGASLRHGYVNREAKGAAHFKSTLVTQVGRLHARRLL